MYNPKDIKVDAMVVPNRVLWDKLIPEERDFYIINYIINYSNKGINLARCYGINNGNHRDFDINNLIKVPKEGEKVTIYKPKDCMEFPCWAPSMVKYDGATINAGNVMLEESASGIQYPILFSQDYSQFNIWWLSPPEVLKESVQKKEDDLYCSCSNPNIKLVDYSIGGPKKEYEFCTCCKKEYLPF